MADHFGSSFLLILLNQCYQMKQLLASKSCCGEQLKSHTPILEFQASSLPAHLKDNCGHSPLRPSHLSPRCQESKPFSMCSQVPKVSDIVLKYLALCQKCLYHLYTLSRQTL